MQRQAVPLIKTESPIVGTGIEYRAARDSGVVILAKNPGVVEKVTANEIIIRTKDGKRDTYKLPNTCAPTREHVSTKDR